MFRLRTISVSPFFSAACCAVLIFATAAHADEPTVGSANVASATPTIPPPPGKACTVTLFRNQEFANYSAKPFSFTPPADCPGPWQKVVLDADYSVTAGRQFDRTAEIWLGGAVLYFGTTEEPSSNVSPTWHIQRDLTDYAPLFQSAQTGHADLGNTVNGTYTGVLYGTATLTFYPRAANVFDHPNRPDMVLPMSAGPTAGTTTLRTGDDQLAATFTFPRNVERAFLDVYAQSQHADEFWYTCVPNDVANELYSCPGTGFREAEVSVDGQPAGVAPVYPWVYTGGVDPFLWRPIPGVQTLSFAPYRVDLTPFAGMLDDGQPHTVAISVFNASNYFSVAGNLLLYLDHGAAQLSGSVTTDTLAETPSPQVDENLTTDGSGNVSGNVTVTSDRQFTIAGTLDTSHGTVDTQIDQTINFSNSQDFVVSDTVFSQHITQGTTIDSTTRVKSGAATAVLHEQRSYPFVMNIDQGFNNDGSFFQTTNVDQDLQQTVSVGDDGFPMRTASLDNHDTASDTLNFDSSFNYTGHSGQQATQSYTYSAPYGACYSRDITADSGVLSSVTDGQGCHGNHNNLHWLDLFRNEASSVFGATVQLLP